MPQDLAAQDLAAHVGSSSWGQRADPGIICRQLSRYCRSGISASAFITLASQTRCSLPLAPIPHAHALSILLLKHVDRCMEMCKCLACVSMCCPQTSASMLQACQQVLSVAPGRILHACSTLLVCPYQQAPAATSVYTTRTYVCFAMLVCFMCRYVYHHSACGHCGFKISTKDMQAGTVSCETCKPLFRALSLSWT